MNIERIAAVAMQNDQQRTVSISHNLANATTPGFKSTVPFHIAFDVRMGTSGNAAMPQFDIVEASISQPSINMSAGAMQVTNSTSDIAIEGDSWFELNGPHGSLFTRVGRLHVDQNGNLLGPGNLPVLGEAGSIQLVGDKFSVDRSGNVVQNGSVVGRLRRVRFDNSAQLLAQGDGTYAQGSAKVTDGLKSDPIRSGVLEASNVDSAAEMVRLTDTVRHFESLQKIVQGYDDAQEAMIKKLGEF